MSILLTAIALLLWSHSILTAKLEIGHLGLASSLPATFFVALAFLSLASVVLWGSKENHGKLLFLQLLIFIAAIWLIPPLTGGSPPFTDHAYRNLGMVEYITRQGYFDPTALFYQSWPGIFVSSAISAEIGSIEFEPLISVFPFLMQLLYLLPLYLFLKNTLGKTRSNYLWAGVWLFYLANWIAQDYFGPPAWALFLLLTLLALVTDTSIRQKNTGFILPGLVVLVFAALATTHLLTSLAALCILGAIVLVRRSKGLAVAVGICLLLLISWDITGAEGFVTKRFLPGSESPVPGEVISPSAEPSNSNISILDPESYTLDPGIITEREITGHFTGSKSHIVVAMVRLPFSAVFALIGLIGVILAFRTKRNFSITTLVLVIALAPLVLLPLSVNYVGEFAQRLFLYALAPMAYFAIQILEKRRWAITLAFCLLLVIGIPLHVIAHYGNEAMDYLSPGQTAGMYFFNDNTRQGYVTGKTIGKMENAERYQPISFDRLSSQNGLLLLEGQFDRDLPHYVAITRQEREYYRFFLGTPEVIDGLELKLNQSANYNFIYDSTDLKLYIGESIKTTGS